MKITVHEITPWLGVEILGFVPSYPLDEVLCRELQGLMKDHEVLLFRGLEIDRRFQNYLCELLRAEG